jgi:hypothetical protein
MRSALAVVLATVFLPLSAQATSVAPLDLPELTARSTRVVHGEVIGTASEWNADRSMIVTRVTVRVTDTLSGDAGETVTFTQPGGRVGALRVDVPGAAAFRNGEEGVWFLAPGPGDALYLNGLDRGRYRVETRADGSKRIPGLTPSDFDALGAGPPPGMTRVSEQRGPVEVDLDVFKQGVRALARGERPGNRDDVRDGGGR